MPLIWLLACGQEFVAPELAVCDGAVVTGEIHDLYGAGVGFQTRGSDEPVPMYGRWWPSAHEGALGAVELFPNSESQRVYGYSTFYHLHADGVLRLDNGRPVAYGGIDGDRFWWSGPMGCQSWTSSPVLGDAPLMVGSCPNAEHPDVDYLGDSPQACGLADFFCGPEWSFITQWECGCGCVSDAAFSR